MSRLILKYNAIHFLSSRSRIFKMQNCSKNTLVEIRRQMVSTVFKICKDGCDKPISLNTVASCCWCSENVGERRLRATKRHLGPVTQQLSWMTHDTALCGVCQIPSFHLPFFILSFPFSPLSHAFRYSHFPVLLLNILQISHAPSQQPSWTSSIPLPPLLPYLLSFSPLPPSLLSTSCIFSALVVWQLLLLLALLFWPRSSSPSPSCFLPLSSHHHLLALYLRGSSSTQ